MDVLCSKHSELGIQTMKNTIVFVNIHNAKFTALFSIYGTNNESSNVAVMMFFRCSSKNQINL